MPDEPVFKTEWVKLTPEEQRRVIEKEKWATRVQIIEANLSALSSHLDECGLPHGQLGRFKTWMRKILDGVHARFDEVTKTL